MTTLPKIDLAKLHKADYAAPKKPVLLKLNPARYLAIAGQGAPGGERFSACIGGLYAMAFTIKMTRWNSCVWFAATASTSSSRVANRYSVPSSATSWRAWGR